MFAQGVWKCVFAPQRTLGLQDLLLLVADKSQYLLTTVVKRRCASLLFLQLRVFLYPRGSFLLKKLTDLLFFLLLYEWRILSTFFTISFHKFVYSQKYILFWNIQIHNIFFLYCPYCDNHQLCFLYLKIVAIWSKLRCWFIFTPTNIFALEVNVLTSFGKALL